MFLAILLLLCFPATPAARVPFLRPLCRSAAFVPSRGLCAILAAFVSPAFFMVRTGAALRLSAICRGACELRAAIVPSLFLRRCLVVVVVAGAGGSCQVILHLFDSVAFLREGGLLPPCGLHDSRCFGLAVFVLSTSFYSKFLLHQSVPASQLLAIFR